MKKISIAIDGPSAAGKSTIAKIVAKKLDYVYIDTGAMYRCVALYVKNKGISFEDEQGVCRCLNEVNIVMDPKGGIFLNGEEVGGLIRTDEISMGASTISGYKLVREFLVAQQQAMSKSGGVILDGRDIGTVVLKDAELKIFQIASSEKRAMRRYLENKSKGMDSNLKEIQKEIEKRDYQDTNRANSPLKPADDAIQLDTSDMNIDQVVDKVLELVEEVAKEK